VAVGASTLFPRRPPNLPLQLLKPLAVSVSDCGDNLLAVGEETTIVGPRGIWVGARGAPHRPPHARDIRVPRNDWSPGVRRLLTLNPEELVEGQVVDGRDALPLRRAPGPVGRRRGGQQ